MTTNASSSNASRGLNAGLWAAQLLLALMFGMAGTMKSTQPIAEIAKKLPWAGEAPWSSLVRFIGVSELAGALGLVLPSATRIKPALTVFAAYGLMLIMVLAAIFHVSRGEFGGAVFNVILGGVLGFVAWGRSKKAPIAPR